MDNNKIPGQLDGDEIIAKADEKNAGSGSAGSDETWLKFARDAWNQSTSYFDTNYKRHWDDDLRMFNSRHPRDSKYLSDAYKYRSRYFRPKTRSMVRRSEAQAALAFFSNPDILAIDPVNVSDLMGSAGAALMKEVMTYRLTKSIPWFLTVCGGYQDALSVGVVASLNTWCYRERPSSKKVKTQFGGMELEIEMDTSEVLADYPEIRLFPVERIKFHPAADWTDVVGTSPYLILEWPMYLRDVLERMEDDGPSGYRKLSESAILSARITADNTTDSARNNYQEDPQKAKSSLNEFDMVDCRLNFIKVEDETYTYWTLRDRYILSDPRPVSEVFKHCKDGRPPVTIGFSILETHKAVKSSAIRLGSELQREANEIANQRGDNVKFVLNKRWFVRRGANVDVESIVRNVPGGVTMVNDVEKDAREVNWQDVTQSAYVEQDRINADYDSVTGNGVDQANMQQGQQGPQPVGTMRMMNQGAGAVSEYTLLTYVKTWVEPTLQMLARMEAAYETDEVVLAVAGQGAQLPRFGQSDVMDRLLAQDLTLTINVGMGATDPDARFQRLMAASGAYVQMATQGSPDLNLPVLRQTLFALAGFRDNKKFFTNVDPRLVQAQQLMQQAQGIAEKVVQAAKDRVQRREIQLNKKQSDLQLQEMAGGGDIAKKHAEIALKAQEQQFNFAHDSAKAQQDMALDRAKAANDIQLERERAEVQRQIAEFQAEVDAEIARYKAHVEAEVARTRPQPEKKAA